MPEIFVEKPRDLAELGLVPAGAEVGKGRGRPRHVEQAVPLVSHHRLPQAVHPNMRILK